MSRIDKRFAALKTAGRAGLVTFITAGDPDHETCARLLAQLPDAGADVIELGMPFSDPMADGPAIQMAGQRALAAGQAPPSASAGGSGFGLLAQASNLASPRFWSMVADILRFYRNAVRDLPTMGSLTLDEYLALNGYGRTFRDEHLYPMAAAIWA